MMYNTVHKKPILSNVFEVTFNLKLPIYFVLNYICLNRYMFFISTTTRILLVVILTFIRQRFGLRLLRGHVK